MAVAGTLGDVSNPDQLVSELAALAAAIDQGERDDDPEAAKELARKYLELDRMLLAEASMPSRWPRRY